LYIGLRPIIITNFFKVGEEWEKIGKPQ
jgi:hypothetical protein